VKGKREKVNKKLNALFHENEEEKGKFEEFLVNFHCCVAHQIHVYSQT
jgi:hypothetical protein